MSLDSPQNQDAFMQLGHEHGRRHGYDHGKNNGFRAGIARMMAERGIRDGLPKLDMKIVYVSSGIGVPYPAIDEAVVRALQGLVSDLIVAAPSDPVAAIAKSSRPDWVLVLNGVVLPLEQIQEIRQQGIKTAVWFTDDPYYTDWTAEIAPNYDVVFTLELSCVQFYRSLNCQQVYYMPFAVDPVQYAPKPVEYAYHSDICFFGTAYWNRVAVIDELAPHLADYNFVIGGWWWDRLKNYKKLASGIQLGTWLQPMETSAYYNGAKIVLNIHREAEDDSINHNGRKVPAHSMNPRTFEINGCASLQMIDSRQELAHSYVPDKEIVTFDSVNELLEKIRYYLEHEEERREIAWNGFKRTMRDHTYRKRVFHLLTILKKCQ